MTYLETVLIALVTGGLIFSGVVIWVLRHIVPPIEPRHKAEIKPAE